MDRYPDEKKQGWESKKVDLWRWYNNYKCFCQTTIGSSIFDTYSGMVSDLHLSVTNSWCYSRMHFRNALDHMDSNFIHCSHQTFFTSLSWGFVKQYSYTSSICCMQLAVMASKFWMSGITFDSCFSQSFNHYAYNKYRDIPMFGCRTIRKFNNNVSAMKKLAAQDFKDLLQVGVKHNNRWNADWWNSVCYSCLWRPFFSSTWQDHTWTAIWTSNMARIC